MASTVYEQIKSSKQLPSPTGVALEVLRLSQDPNSTVDEFAGVIEADPALSSRVLKLVNCPLSGLSRQITSVSRAAALLGVKTVTQLTLGFSLVDNNRKGACSAFDYDLFWSESLAVAVASRHIVNYLKCFPPDEVFTTGLISQVGRLALATAFPEAYANALYVTPADNPRELADIEEAVFSINHCALAAEMMADWHVPVVFQRAVRAQLEPDTHELEPDSRPHLLARILNLAASIASILPTLTVHREGLTELTIKAHRLGIPPDVYPQVFDSISEEWREASTIYSVHTRRVPSLAEIYSQARMCQRASEMRPGQLTEEDVSEGRYVRG
ncbi:MAG: HDOD domain-containing protein [Phycisphaerales bacterium]|nr:MAG: HDOD domain-containing protein [Phycisphaerales bacterium]